MTHGGKICARGKGKFALNIKENCEKNGTLEEKRRFVLQVQSISHRISTTLLVNDRLIEGLIIIQEYKYR